MFFWSAKRKKKPDPLIESLRHELVLARTRLRAVHHTNIALHKQLEEMTERWKHAKDQKEKHRLEKSELKKQLSALTPSLNSD